MEAWTRLIQPAQDGNNSHLASDTAGLLATFEDGGQARAGLTFDVTA